MPLIKFLSANLFSSIGVGASQLCKNVYAHCSKYGITLHATYHIRSDATIVNMVAQGLGAAISPRLAAEPIPAGVQVYSLPVPLLRVISVAVLADALLTPAAFAFLDLLKSTSRGKQT